MVLFGISLGEVNPAEQKGLGNGCMHELASLIRITQICISVNYVNEIFWISGNKLKLQILNLWITEIANRVASGPDTVTQCELETELNYSRVPTALCAVRRRCCSIYASLRSVRWIKFRMNFSSHSTARSVLYNYKWSVLDAKIYPKCSLMALVSKTVMLDQLHLNHL